MHSTESVQNHVSGKMSFRKRDEIKKKKKNERLSSIGPALREGYTSGKKAGLKKDCE